MWNEKLGFLGTCPSNIGTGLRASVMAVLPNFKELKGCVRLYVCMNECMYVIFFLMQIARAFHYLLGVWTATKGTSAARRKERLGSLVTHCIHSFVHLHTYIDNQSYDISNIHRVGFTEVRFLIIFFFPYIHL